MKRKLRWFFRILLVLTITAICIACGFRTRKLNGIKITQFKPVAKRSMGYMIETRNNKIVMIDGGLPEDYEHVEKAILDKGGVVEAWFITHAHDDHASVIIDVLKSGKIQINNIYVSFNSEEWYDGHEELPERKQFAKDLITALDDEKIRDKVHEVALKEELTIDNLFFKMLKVKNPEYTQNAGNNQSMVIKVSNNIKSVIFLADLGAEYEDEFFRNNLDEIKADAVQISHHGQGGVTEKIYSAINPSICLWPTPEWLWNNDPGDGSSNGPWKTLETRSWIEKIGATNYVAKDGDITINIY